ncbi:ester cyclase [Pedobacter sp. P351]|uniref:ester cyclase n=1 Tax=Pedobacter superstes TaxID=3133441 RepID=UPI0030A9382C
MKTRIPMLILLTISVSAGYAQQSKTQVKNKEVTAKIMKAFDDGDANALDNLIAADAVSHSEMPPEIKSTGLQAVKEMLKMQKAAFPDIKTKIHVMAVAGDTVIAYFTSTGTNSGSFMGMPATNKKINTEGVDIIRFKNGKAVEHWGVYDNMKMMQQLGMMPPPPPPVAPAMPGTEMKKEK